MKKTESKMQRRLVLFTAGLAIISALALPPTKASAQKGVVMSPAPTCSDEMWNVWSRCSTSLGALLSTNCSRAVSRATAICGMK